MAATRAQEEIHRDAVKLVSVHLRGAVEDPDTTDVDWLCVYRLAERLQEIAQRGMHHAAQSKQTEITAFAMQWYKGEPEAR